MRSLATAILCPFLRWGKQRASHDRNGVLTLVHGPMPILSGRLIGPAGVRGAEESIHAGARRVFVDCLEGLNE